MPRPDLVARYDQMKASFDGLITQLIDKWREQHGDGRPDHEIFASHLGGLAESLPTREYLMLAVAFLTERLARSDDRR